MRISASAQHLGHTTDFCSSKTRAVLHPRWSYFMKSISGRTAAHLCRHASPPLPPSHTHTPPPPQTTASPGNRPGESSNRQPLRAKGRHPRHHLSASSSIHAYRTVQRIDIHVMFRGGSPQTGRSVILSAGLCNPHRKQHHVCVSVSVRVCLCGLPNCHRQAAVSSDLLSSDW